MVIERGVGLTAQDNDEDTPLHLASRVDHVGIAHIILEHGAAVNAKNRRGLTPLNLAWQCECELVEVTNILLRYGADPGAQESMYSADRPSHEQKYLDRMNEIHNFIRYHHRQS